MVAHGIVLIRHAQSTWNAEGRFQGQADPPLSDLGAEQAAEAARAIASRFSGDEIRLVCSDLDRAASTADALAAALGIEATRDREFREVHGGAWQGLMQPAMAAGWPQEYQRWRLGEDVPWGGAERHSEAGSRVAAALYRWARVANEQGRLLVVVGHGASLRAAVAHLLGWSGGYPALGPLGNTAVVELSSLVQPGAVVRLLAWNVPVAEAVVRSVALPDHATGSAALHLAAPGL